MGKPSKKSLAKVEAAPVVAAPVKPGKKGKRDADEVVAKVANAKKQKLEVKTAPEPSDSDDSEESEVEEEVQIKGNGAVPAKAPAGESGDDDSEEGSSSEEENEEETTKAVNTAVTPEGEVESSEDDDDSEDDESDDVEEKPTLKTVASEKKTEDDSSENESEEEDERDEEMPDAKTPKTVTKQTVKPSEKNVPQTPQASGSKTLFMGNLPFKIEKEDIITFFKEAGAEVYAVRIGMKEVGRSKGFSHIEFATPEDAQKGLTLNGINLWDRPVRLDLAREKGEYTPNTGIENQV